jgi:hypothetical protein
MRGGTLRLKVAVDGGAPREFVGPIKSRSENVAPGGPGRHPQAPAAVGNGVNVWDKFGGSRGSNRDDPTQ